ncbi:MAG: DUF1587 domain-containing protein, partial [Verrucomicrobia bacterium]|nr:DUF1587 domain-containing protein [Verrucomicrobiota bacterium]
MAGVTVVGEDRADVAVEINLARRGGGRREGREPDRRGEAAPDETNRCHRQSFRLGWEKRHSESTPHQKMGRKMFKRARGCTRPRPEIFMRHSPLIALGLLAWLGAAVRLGAADLRGFTQAHCIECHGGEVTKGGLDLTKLKLEPGIQENFARWEMVFDRVAKGEMPPKKSAQPPAEGRATFVKSLGGELHAASLARQRVDGRVLVRRLNVTEYETTLRDLLGRQVAVKDLLPPDETAAGFDKV